MSASDIARGAYEQAIEAEKARVAAEEARKAEEERKVRERHQATFEMALPILAQWFPGIEWDFDIDGDYRGDVIIFEDGKGRPPEFKLRAQRRILDMNHPSVFSIELEIGEYRPDRMSGYTYFAGTKVNSAADIGRHLAARDRR